MCLKFWHIFPLKDPSILRAVPDRQQCCPVIAYISIGHEYKYEGPTTLGNMHMLKINN